MKNITDLNNEDFKKFLLKSESYCNIELPTYINFQLILDEISKEMKSFSFNDYKKDSPSNIESINYSLMTNKDGLLSWREFKLIHPVLYISLTNLLSEKNNWKIIKEHLTLKSKIKCLSLPVILNNNSTNKAAQINSWWKNIEQKSIKLSLDYEYIFHTDITNFYPSIYTHSIAWAFDGKEVVKKMLRKGSKKSLGDKVDYHLNSMSYGQTNGIPQGSAIMDIIAEILLKKIDLEFTSEIKKHSIEKFEILRYRDDYRVFTNNQSDGHTILQVLSKTLSKYGLSLNKFKTSSSSSIITSSIKEDKISLINHSNIFESIQKNLLSIYFFSEKHPNSGSLIKLISTFYDKATLDLIKKEDRIVLISIITQIMFQNPKAISVCAAVISKILNTIDNELKRNSIIKKIIKKSENYPYSGMIQIWMQRITLAYKTPYEFDERMCCLINQNSNLLWENSWLHKSLKEKLEKLSFVDEKIINKMKKVIEQDEFNIFSQHSL